MAYSKQTWVRGEKVASAKLNHMEDGIYENSVTLEHGIEAAVDNWLDEHPEATTTVQDGSLTEAKFSDALKLKTIKDYVTPEMYGAKGDGVSNDTTAFQSAINSGKKVFAFGNYKTNSPLIINNMGTVIRCYGNLTYSGQESAVVLTTSNCNIYFKSITSNANGIELRPDGTDTSKLHNCSNDIVGCDDILCSSGYGLYLNANDGLIQFSEFNINSIRGNYNENLISGVHISTTSEQLGYVNANVFNINSISYTANAIYIDGSSSYACIDNIFNNIHFEDNTYSINCTNTRFRVNGMRVDGIYYGKIKINDGVRAVITIDDFISENIAFETSPTTNNSFYHFIGGIYDKDGNYLCDELYITKHGYYAPRLITPTRNYPYSLIGLYGDSGVGYVNTDGRVLKLPAVSLSGYSNPIKRYTYYFSAAETGSQTVEFSDGSTQQITWDKYKGVIHVIPRMDGAGSWAIVTT